MYQYKDLDDTIAAISTPTGSGGIGIVRLSGKDAVGVADKIFVGKSNKTPSDFKAFSVHLGSIITEKKEVVDEVLLTVMRAPKSYTTEDVVEISCHGGIVSLKAILFAVINLGARLAEPGEFTKRAFLNGRIDLTQAEAVLDIINSKTETYLKVSANQLKGELSLKLEEIRQELMGIYTNIEAMVNFPEDEIDDKSAEEISSGIVCAKGKVEHLLESSAHGKILREGIKIVIAGRPNVGKSSLLNVLLKVPRAIVSEIAGTTRDTIEETVQIKGIPFQIVDTAGILEPRDTIEKEAVNRSHMNIKSADLVLFVLDASVPLTSQDEALAQQLKDKQVVIVLNKCDLGIKIDKNKLNALLFSKKMLEISCVTLKGVDALENAIVEDVWHGKAVDSHGILVSNLRHIESLTKCRETLNKANDIFSQGVSLEFISEDIKYAINCLDTITGRNVDKDLLEDIFSQFCIGK